MTITTFNGSLSNPHKYFHMPIMLGPIYCDHQKLQNIIQDALKRLLRCRCNFSSYLLFMGLVWQKKCQEDKFNDTNLMQCYQLKYRGFLRTWSICENSYFERMCLLVRLLHFYFAESLNPIHPYLYTIIIHRPLDGKVLTFRHK